MKRILALLTFIAVTGTVANAQVDRGGGGISIPRSTAPATAPQPSAVPSDYVSPFKVDPFKKEFKSDLKVGAEEKPKSVIIEEKDKFVTGSSEYQDRVTIRERGESNEAYKGNRSFGEFTTKSGYINLMCRDFGAEDGDRIKISINGRVIVSNTTLHNDFSSVLISLDPGFNLIEIEALNQGTSGPNTAAFAVLDDKDSTITSNEWNLATGFKATFLIIKEQEETKQ